MKLYIMRHGETDWNSRALLQGNTDIPLNENGRKLADLSGTNMTHIPFDLCISSPLSRAYETAGLILQYNPGYRQRFESLGLTPSVVTHGCPVVTDSRITEVHLGPWEGKQSYGPGCILPGGSFDCYWNDMYGEHLPEGVEPPCHVADRAEDFLRDISARPSLRDKTILVTVHGGLIQCLLWAVRGRETRDRRIPYNCEAVKLETGPEGNLIYAGRELFYDQSLAVDFYAHATNQNKS